MSRHPLILLVTVSFALLLGSCGQSRAPSLAEEELFILGYGKMEDEIELFMNGGAIDRKTRRYRSPEMAPCSLRIRCLPVSPSLTKISG